MQSFPNPLKNQKTLQFSDVFIGYRKNELETDGLAVMYKWLCLHM